MSSKATCSDCVGSVDCGRYTLGRDDCKPCDLYKPPTFSGFVYDGNDDIICTLTFKKHIEKMECIIETREGEAFPMDFSVTDANNINSVTNEVLSRCKHDNRRAVLMSIGSVFNELQEQSWYRNKKRSKAVEKVETPSEELVKNGIPEHIKAKAREIAEHGNPFNFILKTHQTLHVGDIGYATVLLLSCANQSVLNADGLQPKGSGASGKGKSHCTKAMAHLIPRDWIKTTRLSNKAIYYNKLKPGMIIYYDDVTLSEEMEGVIKTATSDYKVGSVYETVDKNRDLKVLTIPARLVWWLNSVDDEQSIQLLNRTIGVEVDESDEQDIKVLEWQMNLVRTGMSDTPVTDDVLICREIIRDIKENLYNVEVPYVDDIEWKDTKNRRNFPIFADLVRAFTTLRHRQRDKNENGFLIANLQDFRDAAELYKSRGQAQGTKLTSAERRLCEVLVNSGEMSMKELASKLGITESRITQLLLGRRDIPDSGLKHKVPGLHVERKTLTKDMDTDYKGRATSRESITRNYVMLDKGFNPLTGFEDVVTIKQNSNSYSPYSKLTPNLQYVNSNGRHVFTILTIKENTECNTEQSSKQSDDSNHSITLKSENTVRTVRNGQQMPEVDCKYYVKNEGVNCKNQSIDIENENVSSGQQIAEIEKGKFPPESVSSCGSCIDVVSLREWLSQWEKAHKTNINSCNHIAVVDEYIKCHQLPENMRKSIELVFGHCARIPGEEVVI